MRRRAYRPCGSDTRHTYCSGDALTSYNIRLFGFPPVHPRTSREPRPHRCTPNESHAVQAAAGRLTEASKQFVVPSCRNLDQEILRGRKGPVAPTATSGYAKTLSTGSCTRFLLSLSGDCADHFLHSLHNKDAGERARLRREWPSTP